MFIMKIYDRQGKEVIVDQSQNQFLEKLYSHMLGRCVLKVLTLPFVTRIGGWYMSSGLSKGRIKSFIKSQHIDMSQFVCENYACYNDFFTRRIVEGARPIDQDKSHLIDYIAEDELVEVTPTNIRLRKKVLKEGERRKAEKRNEDY